MTTLTFLGGVGEIGGNKILVEDGDTRLFLDFGMSFGQAKNYFSEFLQPRKCNGVGDFIEFGLLPDIKGIYRQDYLAHMGKELQDEPYVTDVLLTHAHADHASYIHHLRKDINIWVSPATGSILHALDDTART